MVYIIKTFHPSFNWMQNMEESEASDKEEESEANNAVGALCLADVYLGNT